MFKKALGLVVFILTSSAFAESVTIPKFSKGSDYKASRQVLQSLGWEPWISPDRDCHADGSGTIPDICKSFPEVISCAGTGLGNCIFSWGKKMTVIKIYTIDEPQLIQEVDCVADCAPEISANPPAFEGSFKGRADGNLELEIRKKNGKFQADLFTGFSEKGGIMGCSGVVHGDVVILNPHFVWFEEKSEESSACRIGLRYSKEYTKVTITAGEGCSDYHAPACDFPGAVFRVIH